MTPQQIDRYVIKSEIGRGGMATVYLAHDPRFRRDVAIKVLAIQFMDDPTFRARFEREAQAIAAIEHPAIVPVYDFGEEGGMPYLVMRYMPGGSLSNRLKKGALTFTEAAGIISRLAPALDAIHDQGIIHRDLKPGNILFDGYGNAYLSDFGIALLTQATTTLTGEAIIGTPSYMSPEQVRGDADIDGRSDIYALGAILFEMLTGKQPYEATTPMGVAMKQLTDPVPRIRAIKADLPAEIEMVIEKAMAKARDQRFARAEEMAALQGQIASRLSAPPRVKPFEIAEEPGPLPALAETVADTPAVESGPIPGEVSPPAGPPLARTGLAGAHPAGEILPRRRLSLPWIVTGLVVLAGVCGLIGLAMAGSFTLMPGLLARAKVTPVQTTPPQVTQEAVISPEEISRLPETEVAAIPETTVPEETPAEETPPVESTFFEDDFSDPDSGWFIGQEAGSDIYYDQGGYRILVDRPNIIAWATPGLYFSDVSLEVNATKVAGADENLFGLVCRYQDEQNFYLLVIGSDGWYEIGKYKEGKYSQIEETAGYNDAIHRGRTSNRIRADCIRNTLTLYINDLRLVRVTDDEFAAGDVGLTAAAFKIGNTNILFDDFVARKP